VRYGDLYTSHEFFIHASRSRVPEEKAKNYTRIEFGDALLAGSGETIDEIGKSAVCLMRSEARCGGDIILFRSQTPVDAKYLGYATGSRPAILQKAAMGRGITVMHVYANQLKRLALPMPPLPEQSAIVRFLDYVDRRVWRYIREKEKLIRLLEEQRRTAIGRAVTGEMDVQKGRPHAAYRDSGVEWLERVPIHWSRTTLGKVATSVQTGPFGSQLHASEYIVNGVPVINPSHLAEGRIRPDRSVAVTELKATKLSRHRLATGDIVMARRGEVGRSALVQVREAGWVCGTGSLRVRPRRSMCRPEYLLLLLNSSGSRDALALYSIGSTMPNLNAQVVSRLRIWLPPHGEQVAITQFCQRVSDRYSNATRHALRQIEALGEYRTRLIADVVTGKLDVREAARSLPKVDPLAMEAGLEESSGSHSTTARPLRALDNLAQPANP
jgi:type I restriction enzyme S subunit